MDIIKRTSEIAAAVTGRNGQPAAPTEDTPEPQKPRNIITPTGAWPPPIYVDASATEQESYYMEHRWYTQWNWYDTKASQAKKEYQRLQIMIGIGSVTVPVLVSLAPIAVDTTGRNALTLITVFISLLVAAAAIENVKNYGEAWRTYRSAAEDLKREKSLYDVRSGPYRKSKRPFLLFVERCEDIMAKQNGSWAAPKEEQQSSGTAQNSAKDEDDGA